MQYPVLYGIEVGDNFIVWCPWCRKEHHHGAGKDDEGHRIVHCENKFLMSPFTENGYCIKKDIKLFNRIKIKYPYSKDEYKKRYLLWKKGNLTEIQQYFDDFLREYITWSQKHG